MLGLFSVALERTQQGGLSAHLFLLSPHSSPPSGCEDICSLVSLGAGAQEQSRVLHCGGFVQENQDQNMQTRAAGLREVVRERGEKGRDRVGC